VFKAFIMGGFPENLTAGGGVHDDHSLILDAMNHLGSDIRNDRDNSTIAQHV
jgi:hypothetical protein